MTQPNLQLDLSPSEAQLGKYRLVATLGQGGMGTVYLALASGIGTFRKLIVVKELRRDLPWKESSLAMFLDEAHLAARLDHPNVLQTFEAGEDHGRYYLAMEYLDGQPLNALLERARTVKRGLDLELQIHILCEVLNGLQYAHELRDYDGSLLHVVHRDVSPQNVFVTYHGQIKIVDFGVAKANSASNLTSPGVFKGKFAYAAPEQLLGRPVDGRCDVFAVGVMLWEAISGRRFGDPTPTPASFRTRTGGREPRIAQVVPHVEPLLAEICDRALAVDPEQRFVSAAAFRYRLQEYLALQGERIENAQISALMRELFERERRTMHQVIERAMSDAGATRSVIQALPIQVEPVRDREVTARADLSSLIEASHHSDEQRIRESSIAAALEAELARPRTSRERFEPPRWASAAILLGLAIFVFVTTYQLNRPEGEPESALPPPRPPEQMLTHTLPHAPVPAAPPSASSQTPASPQPSAASLSTPASAKSAAAHEAQASVSNETETATTPEAKEPKVDDSEREPESPTSDTSEPKLADAPQPKLAPSTVPGTAELADAPQPKNDHTNARSHHELGSGPQPRDEVLRTAPIVPAPGRSSGGDPGMGSNLKDFRRAPSQPRIDFEDPYQ